MKSRRKIMFACGLAALILGLLFSLYGYDKTWRLWNIPTMSPHFADLRGLLAGAESRAQGFDPMINNPGDPWQRRVDYPRVWQILYSFGVDQSHTTGIGIAFILLFLMGVCLILPHASNPIILFVMAAVLSPATLLGVERVNTDVLMFFIVSVAVVAVQKWPIFSAAAVLLGFVLKIFPIFGCAVLLRVSQSLFVRYVLIMFAFFTLYIILIYSDLLLIKEALPQSALLTYGLNVFWMGLRYLNTTIGEYARFLSYLTVLFSLMCAFIALRRDDFRPERQSPSVYLDAFRAGAAIYLGTFLLNNNWDHRLMFLIFTIPQLVIWCKCSARYMSISSIVILSSMLLSMWYLIILKITCNLPYGCYASYMLNQIFHWIVFTGLLYLFFWSMPDWLKEYAQKMNFPGFQDIKRCGEEK